MGKLVWAAIGFAAAAFGAEYFLPIPGLPYFAAALAVLSPAAFLLKRKYRRPAQGILLSAAVGLFWWWGYYELHVAPGEALVGQDAVIAARVTEYPQATERYTRLAVRVTDGAPRERAYLYLYSGGLPEVRPGDEITAEIRVRTVMDHGASDLHTNTSTGINLRGYFRGDVEITGRWRWSWLYFPQELSHYVKETCESLFPGRIGVFMKALLTGDKQDLYDDVELYGDMRATGVLHAVAVSGFHVFVVVGLVQLLFGRSKRTSLLSLPLIAVLVLMTGAGASVVRAAVMQTMFMAAPIFDRESDSPSAIAAALLLLLLVNPMSIGGVGLQLSFACILGFAVFLPRLSARIARVRLPAWMTRVRIPGLHPARDALKSLAATLSATAFSLPVSAHYFGAVPLLSPLANVLALPVIEVCFAGGYVVCILSAAAPALAKLGARVLSWGVRWCLLVFRLLGRLPFACLYAEEPGAVLWLAFVYGLLLWWLVMRRRRKYLHPGIPVSLGVMGLCLVFLWNLGGLSLGRRELAVLDVGQGECVAFYDGGAAVVVDCGGSGLANAGDVAADKLRSVGVRQVDALVLTHLHEDHTNGAATLMYRMPVRRLYLPADADDEDGVRTELLAAAARYGTEVILLSGDELVEYGELSLTLALPQAGGDENERGIVALVSWPGRSVLVMGDAGTDAELALLERGFAPDVDILVAGHHGSKTASGALFLRAIRAEAAVVSVGAGNSYGLPAEEVMDRLERYCGDVFRTDEDGTVVIPMKAND